MNKLRKFIMADGLEARNACESQMRFTTADTEDTEIGGRQKKYTNSKKIEDVFSSQRFSLCSLW